MKVQAGRADEFLRDSWCSVRAVLLYGPDSGLVRERAARLIATAGSGAGPFGTTQIEGARLKAEPGRLRDELAAIPFGGGQRVVSVRDAGDGATAALAAALADWPRGAVLVVEAGELARRSSLRRLAEGAQGLACIACYGDGADALRSLASSIGAVRGVRFSADALDYIAVHLGADRMASRAEIEKVALYVGDGASASIEDVRAMIGDGAEHSLDAALDAALGGEFAALDLALARCFSSGVSAIALLRAAARELERLGTARAALEAGASLEESLRGLRPPVFFARVEHFKRHVRRWSGRDIAGTLGRILESEMRCKSTGAPDTALAGRTLFEICVLSRRAGTRR